MKRIFLINIISIIIVKSCFAQGIEFGLGSGIGSYTMTDLKNINNKIVPTIPFEAKIVSNFPPYYYYLPYIVIRGNNFGFGICFNFESTGSRISSQDYSGEYRFDMTIHASSPCFYAEYDIPTYNNIRVGIYSIIGLMFSNLKMNEYLHVSDTTITNNTYKFNVQNNLFEPGIEINYKIHFIGIKFNAGYLFQSGSDNLSVIDPTNNANISLGSVKPNWNG